MEKVQKQQVVKENIIGQTLRETRETKGLTLVQVADATRISKAYLQAVEENDYQKIPGEVFVKGVLRGYGNYLGLDGTKIVEQYKIYAQGLPPEEAVSFKIREATNVKITPTFKPNEDVLKDNKNSLLMGLLVLIMLLLAVCAYYFLIVSKPVSTIDNAGKKSAAVIALPSKPPTTATVIPGTIAVQVQCKGICWLKVFDGNKKIFEGTLGKGEKNTFTSKTKLRIIYGNIKDVSITVNGKPEPALKTNKVITRMYELAY